MKLIFTILSFLPFALNATTYYVSNAGNDGNNGTSAGASFATVQHALSVCVDGDIVLLNKGDTFTVSSTLAITLNNFSVDAYGSGAYPAISALQTLSGFTAASNIYSLTTTNLSKNLNCVLVNGNIRAKGRFPNTGYNTYSASIGDTVLTTSLTGTPNYTGFEVFIRCTAWVIDVDTVKSQSSGTLVLTHPVYSIIQGNGYVFQNDSSLLDQANEWSYNATNKRFAVYSTSTPTVQASTLDTLIWIKKQSNVSFKHIQFIGANQYAFRLDTTSNVTIDSCVINNCGWTGIFGNANHYITITHDTITNCLSNAIQMLCIGGGNPSNHANISDNYVKNIGKLAGMGANGDNQYFGIRIDGDTSTIQRNRIDSVGYVPFMWTGRRSLIYRNYITNYCFIKDDGGGIVTYIGPGASAAYLYDTGSIVRGNIITNALNATAGTTGSAFNGTMNIYLDEQTAGVLVDSNTCSMSTYASMYFHGTHDITLRANTFVDSLLYVILNNGATTATTNLFLYSNTYYQRGTSLAANLVQFISPFHSDSNYFVRPRDTTNYIWFNSVLYGFYAYKSATGFDVHGGGSPRGLSSNYGTLYFNPTLSDSTITVNGRYVDAKGIPHISGSITLHPYTSIILFPTSYYTTSNYLFIPH